MSRETLICDTSFVSNLLRLDEAPERYAHWDKGVIDRVETELLAVSVVTVAEVRAGYAKAGWGPRRVARDERRLAEYLPLLIDDPHLNEWARLSAAARASGVALSDNDLWIAATASVGLRVLALPAAARLDGLSRGGRRRPVSRTGRSPWSGRRSCRRGRW